MGLFTAKAPGANGALVTRLNTVPGSHLQLEGRASGPAGLSIIAPDMVVTGNLEAQGVIKIEGHVEGAVRAANQVLVAPGAVVAGDIVAREVVIGGEVRGDIHASDRIELQPTSVVHGHLVAPRLLVHEGGTVNGEIRMKSPDTADLPSPSRIGE